MSQESAQGESGKKSVLVRVLQNVIEAQLAQDALEEAGIAYSVQESSVKQVWDGVLEAQKGWGGIFVAVEDEKQARAILDEALEPIDITEEEWEGDEGAVAEAMDSKEMSDTTFNTDEESSVL